MTPSRLLIAPAVALLGASLVGATLLLRGPAHTAAPPRAPALVNERDDGLRAELEELRRDLEREAGEREHLERELAVLQGEVARLPVVSAAEPLAERARPAGDVPAGKRFDESALLAAGVEAEEARWLHERSDAYELERLYVIDRAQRDGAGGRRRQQLNRLEAELREELGEELYDRLLYAQGKDNRVVVSDVLKRSPAEQTDIRERDVVLRYDDVRMFAPQELRRATMGGVAGESVPVELQRGRALIRVFVPRGPLGITLIRDSRPPAQPG